LVGKSHNKHRKSATLADALQGRKGSLLLPNNLYDPYNTRG